MVLKRKDKDQFIKEGVEELQGKQTVVFVDFTGTKVDEIQKLRRALREAGASMRVIKKRLLNLMLKERGAEFDPTRFEGQVATVMTEGEISEVAGEIYRFSKDVVGENESFKILGGYDFSGNKALDAATVLTIGQLPPREVLLAQVVGTIAAPMRAFVYILSEKSKQSASAS